VIADGWQIRRASMITRVEYRESKVCPGQAIEPLATGDHMIVIDVSVTAHALADCLMQPGRGTSLRMQADRD
jgi:hypothetical protein